MESCAGQGEETYEEIGRVMSEDKDYKFDPDWVSPPGASIKDLLDERGLSLGWLASMMGMQWGYVERLVAGEDNLTGRAAEKLGEVIGPNKEFWINREFQYREGLAKGKKKCL